MNMALITLIPKLSKDATHCFNYRPMSLINTDVKILSKALAIRLETVISHLCTQRQSAENMRRLFNKINLYKTKTDTEINHPAIILTLNAEKG